MADVSGASRPIFLGGKEYQLSPLSDKDTVELDNWLKAEFIRVARSSLSADSSREERDETLRVAMQESQGMSWLSGAGARTMRTIDGVARVLWQGLKRLHPELTHDDVRRLLVDAETVRYVNEEFRELNVGDAARRVTPKGSPKGAARRQTK